MKKKKRKYSLTAKERRDNRVKATPDHELTEKEKAELETQNLKRKQRKNKIIRITAIALVLVIAVSFLSYGITRMVLDNRIDNSKVNPIATITLSNGKVITMELLYIENTPKADDEGVINYGSSNDGRGAVANFIYLANKGFYDGTIFSASNLGFLALEGYTAPDTHRAKDETYVSKLKGFSDSHPNKWNETDFKLGYRIRRASVVNTGSDLAGYMAMIASNDSYFSSSTSFVMVTKNPQFTATIKDSTSVVERSFTSTLSYMAKVADAESLAVMQSITQMTTEANHYVTNWRYPTELKIKSIKITKLNSKLKKNIMNKFEEFVLNTDSEINGAIKSNAGWRSKSNFYPL